MGEELPTSIPIIKGHFISSCIYLILKAGAHSLVLAILVANYTGGVLLYRIGKARWRSSGKGSLKAPSGGACHPCLDKLLKRSWQLGTLLPVFKLPESWSKIK